MAEEYIRPLASLIGISAAATISRAVLSQERRSFGGFCRAMFLAIFVGGITAGLLTNYDFSQEAKGAIVGLCAFVADDILLAIIALAKWFREDPMRIINVVLNRGKSENATKETGASTKEIK